MLEISEENALSSATQIKDLSDKVEKIFKEKAEALEAVEALNQQVSDQSVELESEKTAERLKALQQELQQAVGERNWQAKEKGEALKRLKP